MKLGSKCWWLSQDLQDTNSHLAFLYIEQHPSSRKGFAASWPSSSLNTWRPAISWASSKIFHTGFLPLLGTQPQNPHVFIFSFLCGSWNQTVTSCWRPDPPLDFTAGGEHGMMSCCYWEVCPWVRAVGGGGRRGRRITMMTGPLTFWSWPSSEGVTRRWWRGVGFRRGAGGWGFTWQLTHCVGITRG